MTTSDHQAINYCPHCELDYVARYCAPCPLCLVWANFKAARLEARRSKPYLLLQHTELTGIETLLNDACADDWEFRDIKVGYEKDRDNGRPLFVAVLRREHYDHARHQAAVEARQEALIAHREKRTAIEAETRTFRADRNGGATS